jgi:3-methylfumaryl-CoA hydratase
MASLLLQLAGPVRQFSFRAVSPAVVSEPLHLVSRTEGKAITLGAFAEDGRQVVQAEAAR